MSRTVRAVRDGSDLSALGREMHGLVADLYPICRSITGEGLRATLRRLQGVAPIEIREVPTGTRVLDWTIPREWNVRDAWVADASGRRVVDIRASSLHVVNYSVPVRVRLPLSELREKLHTLPEHPDWVPYRTTYYSEDWGFCLAQRVLDALPDGEYEAVVDSTLADGSLSYGELLLPGRETGEVLLSAHACHPSLANDNLSGLALTATLARLLAETDRRWSYRFLFVPGTIGSIAWLAANRDARERIRHGLVVACVGDAGPLHYKRSRRGDAEVDRAAEHVVSRATPTGRVRDFSPYGYDERQYGSPGFDLPVGSLTRTPHGRYPEYHTSADNPAFVRAESLADSLSAYLSVLAVLEGNGRYLNTEPYGEPQLGRRGLYGTMGGYADPGRLQMAMLWVLNQSDGGPTLLEIADRSDLPFDLIRDAADALTGKGLLREAPAER